MKFRVPALLPGVALALLAATPVLAQPCATTAVGYRVMHLGQRVVAVWYPTTAVPTRYAYSPAFSSSLAFNGPASTLRGSRVPLVVFSHGDLGCGLQSVALTEELARHGYVVAAPDHADALLCHIVPPAPGGVPPTQPN